MNKAKDLNDKLNKISKTNFNEGNYDKFTQEIVPQIDFKALEKEISNLIKAPVTFKQSMSISYVRLESNDLSKSSGVFQSVFKSLILQTEAGGYADVGGQYITRLGFRVSYKSGGSNGVTLCTAFFNIKNKKWTIEQNF